MTKWHISDISFLPMVQLHVYNVTKLYIYTCESMLCANIGKCSLSSYILCVYIMIMYNKTISASTYYVYICT